MTSRLSPNVIEKPAPPRYRLSGLVQLRLWKAFHKRKQRRCPIWPETARLLRRLLEEIPVDPHQPETVFRNNWGRTLTRFGIRFILAKYIRRAAQDVPSLRLKRLHPHPVRHSCALFLLRSGVDLSTIAHWLGHADLNTTNKYLSLDLEEKRQALAKAKTVAMTPGLESSPLPRTPTGG